MNKLLPLLLVCLGLLIGVPLGWFVASKRFGSSVGPLSDLSNALYPLRALRSGDTNKAIELLESHLDGAIITVDTLVPAQLSEKKRAGYLRALAKASQYRSAYPRKTDSPEIGQILSNALAAVRKTDSQK